MKTVPAVLLCTLLGVSAVAAQQAPPPSVMVAEVVLRDVTPTFRNIGRVEAMDSVDVRARVQGYIEQRLFNEGQPVAAGDLLFVLEKAPYAVVVEQREAELVGAEASLKNARADLGRIRALREKRVLAQAGMDVAVAAEATAQAGVLQAMAAVKRARLDLGYTEVRTPIDGVIGRARYSTGNLVGPDSDPLATITRMDPVYVTMGVTEKRLLDARRRGIDAQNAPVAPRVILSDGSRYEHEGRFDFLSPTVDQSTDTDTARAVFPNPGHVLLPGQYVQVDVRAKQSSQALVVPQASVQRDQQGYFVLVVDNTDAVEVRRVELGDRSGQDWVVRNGLAAGERVVVQGVQKVRPGQKVMPVVAAG